MSFRTRVDMSSNRQLTQYIETRSVLSGATQFGVPFNQLPTGPNPSVSGTSTIGSSLVSTFSGDSGTTIFTWYDNKMELGHSRLSAITPSNSATTQYTGNVWTGNTSTIIDGNSLFLDYSGVSFDTNVIAMTVLGANSYSGTINSITVNLLTASTLDFTGRTIWVDVSGITRTNDLIINKNPVIGYIWTCIDTEGKGIWSANTGSVGTTHWSAGTGTNSIVQKYSDSATLGILALAQGYKTLATGDYSHAEGRATSAEGIYSHAEGRTTIAAGIASHAEGAVTLAAGDYSHAGGTGSTASGATTFIHSTNSFINADRSVILGGQNITGTTVDTVYLPYLNINYSGNTPSSSGDTMGDRGSIRYDNTYLYLKTNLGWGRITLSYGF
jgi:hypothetical protein